MTAPICRIRRSSPAIAPRIRGIAASGESKVGADLLAQLPALEMISVFGVGYDGVDVAAARARGVPVTNTPDVLTEEVADLGIALMLSIARRIPQADKFVRDGAVAVGPVPADAQGQWRAPGHRRAWAASARRSPTAPAASACRSPTPPAPGATTVPTPITPAPRRWRARSIS